MWFTLAHTLGMSVARCQSEVSSSEFTEWQAYLEMEPNLFHREDHYFAEIIAWLKRAVVTKPNAVNVEDCFLKFVLVNKTEKKKTNWQTKVKAAKNFFTRLTAVKSAESQKVKRTRQK